MATYPLKSLKNIRQHRYDQYSKDRICKEKYILQIRKELTQKQKELTEYQEWRVLEEERRYNQIMNNNYSLTQIQKFNSEIKNLKLKEVEFNENIKRLEIQIEQSTKELNKLIEQEKESYKKLMKINLHEEFWLAEQKQEEFKKENQELEDFIAKEKIKFKNL